MTVFTKVALSSLFLVAVILIDFRLANSAHKKILGTSADFQRRLAEIELDFSGENKQGCEVTRIYIVNAYQTCFVAWIGEHGGDIRGFNFVYHRPQPILQFYGQTSESRYFRFAEYGTRLKQIRRDGFINHLYHDGSENDN